MILDSHRRLVSLIGATAVVAIFAASSHVEAAGTGSSASSGGSSSVSAQQILDDIREAQRFINSRRYASAIEVLRGVVRRDNDNADAFNLLGFASRKLEKTEDAAQYYEAALSIEPNHLGALEYQGELFLMLNEPDKANANLDKLLSICGADCAEYLELKAYIEKHQSSS